MSPVPVKWTTQNSLMDPDVIKNNMGWKERPAHLVPVVELAALREHIQSMIESEYEIEALQRLLTQIGEVET